VSSVTLPPIYMSPGKQASANSLYKYASVIPPTNNYASPRSRPPWSLDRPTRCVCCFYPQTTSIQPSKEGNTSHNKS